MTDEKLGAYLIDQIFIYLAFFIVGVLISGMIGHFYWLDFPLWKRWAVVMGGGTAGILFWVMIKLRII